MILRIELLTPEIFREKKILEVLRFIFVLMIQTLKEILWIRHVLQNQENRGGWTWDLIGTEGSIQVTFMVAISNDT